MLSGKEIKNRLNKDIFIEPFDEKNIKVNMNLSEELPNVKSDFNQMKQVFLNLFQNAIEATPSGGNLNIITESEESFVVIRIIDSGTGIKSEDPELIFEPFFTTKVTGVGLGLANVKKIIMKNQLLMLLLNCLLIQLG